MEVLRLDHEQPVAFVERRRRGHRVDESWEAAKDHQGNDHPPQGEPVVFHNFRFSGPQSDIQFGNVLYSADPKRGSKHGLEFGDSDTLGNAVDIARPWRY